MQSSRLVPVKFAATKKIALVAAVLLLICLVIIQDFVEASIKNFSFYFSESFLFSSFWWIFIPVGYIQYRVAIKTGKKRWFHYLLLTVLPVMVHLVFFPLLVQLLSALFYDHTFIFRQTFYYALSEHLYQLIILYTVPYAFFLLYNLKKREQAVEEPVVNTQEEPTPTIVTLAITDNNRHFTIAVAGIGYFTANTPYVNVFYGNKKYLLTDTLKALTEKLNNQDFVRIHKSTIVNIHQVKEYRSRLNGDYDILMQDGNLLRVSRNYASAFKDRFHQRHQVSVK